MEKKFYVRKCLKGAHGLATVKEWDFYTEYEAKLFYQDFEKHQGPIDHSQYIVIQGKKFSGIEDYINAAQPVFPFKKLSKRSFCK